MGFAEHPPLDADHGEVLPKGATFFVLGLVPGLDLQDADIERPGLAGQLATEVDPLRSVVFVEPDPATLEGNQGLAAPAGEIKEEAAVEKEVALFRKQQREAGEIELARVDLGLRKVVFTVRFARRLGVRL